MAFEPSYTATILVVSFRSNSSKKETASAGRLY